MDLRAVIFVPALAGSVILGFVFLAFAAHYYLTVLEGTGAGAREVTWVSEPFVDNVWKVAYMAWLVGLWLGPAYLLGRAATAGTESAWAKLAVQLLVFWLCYPVSQLSSLSASTMWLPLVPDVFARLAQKPAVTLGFFALSVPVLALFAVGFKWSFLTEGEWPLLFVGSPLLVVSGLLYARLLGRLAFALRFTKGLFPTRKRKKAKKAAAPEPRPADGTKRPPAQPSDLPPIETLEGELTGYDVRFEDESPRKRVRAEVADDEPEPEPATDPEPGPEGSVVPRRPVDPEDADDDVPYGVHEAEVMPADVVPKEVVKPSAEELRLLRRDDAPRKPKRVWGPDVLAFLGQEGTISAAVIASGLCVAAGLMVRIARAFNPVAGGDPG